jgi:hypothetical protein
MEEKKFPIYKFKASWNQDNFNNNGTGYSVMYKEEPTQEQLDNDLASLKKHIEEKYHVTEWLELRYEFYEYESWCLTWFSHYTYNQFDDDTEVERSFMYFIQRKMALNLQNGHHETVQGDFNNKKPFYCFMGAEDNWRWKICRCEHCQKAGKITIDH